MKIVASVLLAFTAFALFAGARSDDDGLIEEQHNDEKVPKNVIPNNIVGGFLKDGEVCSMLPNSAVSWIDSDGIECRCCKETKLVSCGKDCQAWFNWLERK